MHTRSVKLLGAVFVILTFAGDASAQLVSTTNLTCSSTRRLQTAINNVPAGTVGTIVVSGTCNENVVVPHGKTIIIRGANASATISAANGSLPAVKSNGDTTLQGIRVTNAAGASEALVIADRAGFLNIIGSSLAAPNVEIVAAIYGQSGGRIANSRIIGGSYAAVEAWDGSGVVILGHPAESAGPDGFRTVLSSPNSVAVSCGIGSSLAIRTYAVGANSGSVALTNSNTGIATNACGARINNTTASASNISLSGNVGVAMHLGASQFTVNNITVSANNDGINAFSSSVQLERTTFSGNTSGDLTSQAGSTIFLTSWSGAPNSFPNIGTGQNLRCWTGGQIFLDQPSIVQDISQLTDRPACVLTQ